MSRKSIKTDEYSTRLLGKSFIFNKFNRVYRRPVRKKFMACCKTQHAMNSTAPYSITQNICDANRAFFEDHQGETYLWTIHILHIGNGLVSKRRLSQGREFFYHVHRLDDLPQERIHQQADHYGRYSSLQSAILLLFAILELF